jgi:hypothetical protein
MASNTVRIKKEELVALRAYALWEAEGRPESRAEDHWRRARLEIDREMSAPDREIDERTSPVMKDNSEKD